MNLKYPTAASWSTIDHYVQQDRQKNTWFWKNIDARPFTQQSLDQLLSLGLQVEFKKLDGAYGYAYSPEREDIPQKNARIEIHSLLRLYNRDKTLFHELMHVWHGYRLDDGPKTRTKELQRKNTLRVEWLARQTRANPEILQHTLIKLRIQPWIYDEASYDAFKSLCKDPGKREDYCTTRMD